MMEITQLALWMFSYWLMWMIRHAEGLLFDGPITQPGNTATKHNSATWNLIFTEVADDHMPPMMLFLALSLHSRSSRWCLTGCRCRIHLQSASSHAAFVWVFFFNVFGVQFLHFKLLVCQWWADSDQLILCSLIWTCNFRNTWHGRWVVPLFQTSLLWLIYETQRSILLLRNVLENK